MGASLDREPVMAALHARLERLCPSLVTVTRRYRSPTQVGGREKPFAYIAPGTQQAVVRRGAPSYWKLQFAVLLYFKADEGDKTTPPSALINKVVKEIEDALERQPTEPVTDFSEPYTTNLGLPNVRSIRLVTVDTDEGLIDVHGIAGAAIEVEATN